MSDERATSFQKEQCLLPSEEIVFVMVQDSKSRPEKAINVKFLIKARHEKMISKGTWH